MIPATQNTTTLRSFLRDEGAATSIEYALIAGGIAVTIITAISSLGDTVRAMYENISTATAD
jgi:pilus assembly protein Flp/PilA